MKNIEMLIEGVKEIAKNHGFKCNVDYKEEGEVCIYGGCNVPTIGDVQMLCEDVHIDWDESVDVNEDFGIDIYITEEWYEEYGKKRYIKTPYGEMWRRLC